MREGRARRAFPAAPPVVAAPREDTVEFLDVEQGSEDWLRLRLGIPTASNFGTIMASGAGGGRSETRTKLLYRMAGEILTGQLAETYQNAAMLRGNEMEDEACADYEFTHACETERCGFVRRTIHHSLFGDRFVGASPDRLVGADRILEVKTMKPELLIDLVEGQRPFPSEHRAQCQGSLWVTGRKFCDLKIFYRGMPYSPVYTVERDEAYISTIKQAIEVFQYDLRQVVARQRKLGGLG